ncbi:universal stress protein [Pontibacter chitinilyticus]|uniref:universal stress protein n=1 Tax=Pontibacter chitinilyticus TaxID=2674989 RepID=UPI00321BC548
MSKTNLINRILVPVQFNAEGEKLLLYAGQMARAMQAELVLLYAAQVPDITYTQQNRVIQALRLFGERVLLRLPKMATDFVGFEGLVRPGNLQQNIRAVVQENAIDLVLMEACSLPASEAEWGNHAAGIMEAISCPVMVVPPTARFVKPPNLVFATDFTDRDPQVLLRIASFARQLQAHLTLVQVYTAEQRDQLCQMKADLRETHTILAGFEVSLKLLEEEDMLEGIGDFAEAKAADMLVLATRDNYLLQRLFSVNYIKTRAYHTQVPLLTFRQLKLKPCSGCCTNCASKQKAMQMENSLQLVAMK